ncbi:hypothetical protein H6P81_007555 [Aristolochia fimbriata]|uniref:WRKY domain-containing protein n=1 Tax=Aristolochia fimbriata TaxID=158543 RepID=A0AAV7F4A2_ARIFI|nr:hypothetical protein H6P81_007555 [Aristolochia fimbriata]
MAAAEEPPANWASGSEDELVRELLDDETPLFLLPGDDYPFLGSEYSGSLSTIDVPPAINRSTLNLYSGPTLEDIESALSTTKQSLGLTEELGTSRTSTVSLIEKGFNKVDNKYTLKIKSSGSTMADDGYKWRKYGQKSIKNSPNPRSYYRCTNPRCSAKKQVEKSKDEADTLIVTYEGLHLHFAYSHFLRSRPVMSFVPELIQPKKRLKLPSDPANPDQGHQEVLQITTSTTSTCRDDHEEEPAAVVAGAGELGAEDAVSNMGTSFQAQGLLEDIVPLFVRNPLNLSAALSNNETCLLSSSPPSSSSTSSVCWSPPSPYVDVGILSGIL